jgi:DNA-binding PadR family transcriptional regulator
MHWYEIAKPIDGWYKPTGGMIYPTLKEMVVGGYVECTSEIIGAGNARYAATLTRATRRIGLPREAGPACCHT